MSGSASAAYAVGKSVGVSLCTVVISMLSQVSALPTTFVFDLPELATGLSHSEKKQFPKETTLAQKKR